MSSRSISSLRSVALAATATTLLASVFVFASPAPARPPTIYINGQSAADYKFTPRKLEVRRRAKVRWQWDSNAAHNVRVPKLGRESVTGASETFRLRFKRRGTFRYLCTVHGFRGKVVVG